MTVLRTVVVLLSMLLLPVVCAAQAPPPATDEIFSDRREIFNEKNQHHIGRVELKSSDTTIYADDAWYYPDDNKFVATGNVTFAQGSNRISASGAASRPTSHLAAKSGEVLTVMVPERWRCCSLSVANSSRSNTSRTTAR